VKDTLKLMFSNKMMLLNPLMVWNGMSVAAYSGMVPLIILLQLNNDPNYIIQNLSDTQKASKTLQAMIAFGFGEIIGGLLMGKLFDHFGPRKANFFNVLILLMTFSVTLYGLSELRYGWITFLMTFVWGV